MLTGSCFMLTAVGRIVLYVDWIVLYFDWLLAESCVMLTGCWQDRALC